MKVDFDALVLGFILIAFVFGFLAGLTFGAYETIDQLGKMMGKVNVQELNIQFNQTQFQNYLNNTIVPQLIKEVIK